MFKVELDLLLTQGLNWPEYSINIQPLTCVEQGLTKIVTHSGAVDSCIELLYNHKDQTETILENGAIVRDQSIEILNLRIDNIKIQPLMIGRLGVYIPKYRQDFIDYCKQSSIPIDQGPQHVTKFWHAGSWTAALPQNFWMHYSQLRPTSQKNNFTGNSSETIKTNLEKLKQLI